MGSSRGLHGTERAGCWSSTTCQRHFPAGRWISAPLISGGAALERLQNGKIWFFTRPDGGPARYRAVQSPVSAAGCDVIETDNFRGGLGSCWWSNGLEGSAFAIKSNGAAELAREVALEFSTADQPRYVAGSIGPTTNCPPWAHRLRCDEGVVQGRPGEGFESAGVCDLLLVETCQDVLADQRRLCRASSRPFSSTGHDGP